MSEYQCVCLNISVCVWISVCVSEYQNISVCIWISVCVSEYQNISVCIWISVCVSEYQCVYLNISVCIRFQNSQLRESDDRSTVVLTSLPTARLSHHGRDGSSLTFTCKWRRCMRCRRPSAWRCWYGQQKTVDWLNHFWPLGIGKCVAEVCLGLGFSYQARLLRFGVRGF